MADLVKAEFNGFVVTFDERGWINATAIAEKYGKRPVDWVRLDETKSYLAALAKALGISEPKSLIRAKRNSGTWLHPKLGVRFGQWLDVNFAVWCDLQIDALISGTHPHYDWKRLRSEAASSFKVMNAVLQLQRQTQGKATAPHHFQNEAKLVNWALAGKYEGIDRAAMSAGDLEMLAKLEERNAVLIGVGLDRDERKKALEKFVADWRIAHTPALEAA